MTPDSPWAPFASSWHRSAWIARLALGVGLVLSVLPGSWQLGFLAWAVFTGCALSLDVLVLLAGLAFQRTVRDAARSLGRAVLLAAAVSLFWPLANVRTWLDIGQLLLALKDEAMAVPAGSGPRFAWAEFNQRGYGHAGYAYDALDEIARPRAQRSAAWEAHAKDTLFAGDCWGAERLFGHWYLWDNDGCT